MISKRKSDIKNEVIVEDELDEYVNKIRQGKKQTFPTPNLDKIREYSSQNPHKSESLCYRYSAPFDRNHMKYCRALRKSYYNCGGKDNLSNVCKKFNKTLQFYKKPRGNVQKVMKKMCFLCIVDKNKQLGV